jgi:prefoldin subunit 5
MSMAPPQQGQGQNMMFGQPAEPDSGSAARQLISEVAPINSALQQLAQSHPDLSQTIDQMLQLLKQGLMQSISQMQSPQPNQGGNPQIG